MKFPGMFERGSSKEAYSIYNLKPERQAIYEFFRNFTEYLHDEDIKNIIFLDRSARPAWIGIHEYWKNKYGEEKKPGMYFVNPDGFTQAPSRTFQQESLSDIIRALFQTIEEYDEVSKGDPRGFAQNLDSDRKQIRDRFSEVYTKLNTEKNESLVVFDTCAHTGDTIKAVIDTLDDLGFADVRIITATEPDFSSGIIPAAKVDSHIRLNTCFPFGQRSKSLVQKSGDVVSESHPYPDRAGGNLVREELKRIVNEKGK